MELVQSLQDWPGDGIPSAVTVGMFDGVHRGHQALLHTLRQEASARGLRSVVVTFDENPRSALAGEPRKPHLTPLKEKLDRLQEYGVDLCAIIPVSGGILGLTAADFVQTHLVEQLRSKLLVVGYDFRFGRDRAGDMALLRAMSEKYGYNVASCQPVFVGPMPVKSTRIRLALEQGDLEEAAVLLGRLYSVNGAVIRGDARGRTLGFPTANIQFAPDKLLPAMGVYGGFILVDGKSFAAAINLGLRPTVGGQQPAEPLLEAYLLGFSGDLYGKNVELEFGKRLREEERFNNLQALKEQIQRDVTNVWRWSEQHGGQVVAA